MPGLNMGLIKGATVPLPPIEMQGHFGLCLGKLENATTSQSEHARQLERLFLSLQYRAFLGAL
jgi:type I restriction enzyme, S subunit